MSLIKHIEKPKVLGLIPARGGSKGLPRKNLRLIAGKPLISWTIEAALKSTIIDKVLVSTEDEEIADVSRKDGADVPFMRPKQLSQDESLRNEVIAHVLNKITGFDYVILLQPTSPLRTAENIDHAFQQFIESNAKSCVSVTEQHPGPEWIFKINKKKRIYTHEKFVLQNRPDLPKYYTLNGSIYITSIKHFFSCKIDDPFICDDTFPYIMEKKFSIDIDDEVDFEYCNIQINKP